MKKILLATILILSFAPCGQHSSPTVISDSGYISAMNRLMRNIKNNPRYVKLPINTVQEEQYLIGLSYKLYKKQITKQAFSHMLNTKYPGYKATTKWLAQQF